MPTFVLLFVVGWSLAICMGVANVMFQDSQHLIEVVMQIMFYLTPIMYTPEQLPGQPGGLDRLPQPAGRLFGVAPPAAARRPASDCRRWCWRPRRRCGAGRRRGAGVVALRETRDLLSLTTGWRDDMTLIQLDDVGLRFQVRRFGRISLKEYLAPRAVPSAPSARLSTSKPWSTSS